ncbi:MAG: hypothetical protein AAFY71_28305 [Bacteroidota bacterium]
MNPKLKDSLTNLNNMSSRYDSTNIFWYALVFMACVVNIFFFGYFIWEAVKKLQPVCEIPTIEFTKEVEDTHSDFDKEIFPFLDSMNESVLPLYLSCMKGKIRDSSFQNSGELDQVLTLKDISLISLPECSPNKDMTIYFHSGYPWVDSIKLMGRHAQSVSENFLKAKLPLINLDGQFLANPLFIHPGWMTIANSHDLDFPLYLYKDLTFKDKPSPYPTTGFVKYSHVGKREGHIYQIWEALQVGSHLADIKLKVANLYQQFTQNIKDRNLESKPYKNDKHPNMTDFCQK